MSKITLGICSDWINGEGIMKVLTDNFNVPWANTIDGQVLDDDYYGNRSGNKIIAPLVEKFVTSDGVSSTNMLRLARVIYAKYGDGWQRAFDALAEQYNPLHNYDGTETTTSVIAQRNRQNTKGSQTNEETYDEYTDTKGSQTNTSTDDAVTDSSTYGERHSEQTNDIQGFNSTSYQDADKRTVDDDGYTDSTSLGQRHNSSTDGQREDTFGQRHNEFEEGQRIDSEHEDGYTDTVTITKGGNLGVTTSQQMLESEMKFRAQYTLMDSVVFPNVDAVMCLSIFGECDVTLDDFTITTGYTLPTATANRLGGVKIGEGIVVNSDGTISVNVDLSGYVTSEALATALQSYVTSASLTDTLANYITASGLTTILSDYATNTALTNGLNTKQNTLVSGTNIKTINGSSILGSGDVTIQGGGNVNAYDKDKTIMYTDKYLGFNSTYGYAPSLDTSPSTETTIVYRVDISDFAGKWLRGYCFHNKTLGINRCRVAVTTVDLETVTRDVNGKGLQDNTSYSTNYPSYSMINMNTVSNPVNSTGNAINCNYHLPENAKYMYFYIYKTTSSIETSVDDFECNIMVI